MFGGGPLSVPANSPHLRKSGSRPAVYELGKIIEFSVYLCTSQLFYSPVIVLYTFSILLCLLTGTNELGNSGEGDFLLSNESNEMKGVSTPLSSTAILPSPVLLWRFKVLLIIVMMLIATCCDRIC